MKLLNVHNDTSTKDRTFKESSEEGSGELFLSEDWEEIVWIKTGISSIPLFRIDVPSSSESIQFGTKTSRTETNTHVEMKRYSDHCT